MAVSARTAPRTANVLDTPLEPWTFEKGQVLEGELKSSGIILWRSSDGTLANGVWECTPGKFRWIHVDETVSVVAGRVTVTSESGESVDLGPGDLAFFPEGLRSVWHVHETVRKAFHLHSAKALDL
jgi:uncharacterized protein